MLIVEIPETLSYRGPDNVTYTLDFSTMSEDVRGRMVHTVLAHGWCQKMGDSFAAAKDTPMQDRAENAHRVHANAQAGIWAERGGARLDPVLVELRGLVVKHGLAKADAARKFSESDIETILGKRFVAVRKHAEAIVALRDELPAMPMPAVDVGEGA